MKKKNLISFQKESAETFLTRDLSKKSNRIKLVIACMATMCAVSTVFMTQPIFPNLAQSFGIDSIHARLVFSVTSLFYAGSFFVIGPFTDRVNLSRLAFTGLALLSIITFLSSYSSDY